MRATTAILSLLSFFVASNAGDTHAEDAAWSTPSGEVDSTVAEWAINRLRSRPPAESGANPLRPMPAPPELVTPPRDAALVAAPVEMPPAPIEQVRYEVDGYDAPRPTPRNPLRDSTAPSTNAATAEARLAFAEQTSAPPIANPFAKLPPTPTPTPAEEPLRLEVDAQPAPVAEQSRASFEPEAVRSAPAPVGVPVDEEPLDFRPPPSAERIAAVAPQELRPTATTRNWIEEPEPQRPANVGTGRPGGEELEGPQQASVVVEKRGPDEARVGQTSRFVITVRNAGSAPAENVVLRDEAPRGAQLLQTIPPATERDGKLLWSLGALAPGEERGVEIRVVPTEEGQLGSVATVSFETRASAAMRSTRPALAVRLRGAPRVPLGGQQRIQIEVHNPGTGVARNVMLLEDVPDALRHEAGPALELEIGALAPGETRRMELSLTAAQAGRVVNTVTAIADGDLRAEDSVEFDVIAPSLAVAVAGPKRRYLQRPATYEVRVENPGTAPARDVRLVTHLPRGMEFVSANNLGEYDEQTHAVYWSLAELPENQIGAVEVVALPVAAGEHTLRVESEARSGLKASETRRLVVEGMASIAFDIRDLQDPIEVGGEAAYDIVVLNEGTKAAEGVRVTVDAPAGMRVVSAQGKTSHRQTDERVEFAPIDRLEPGVKVLYRVRLRGEQPGDQRVTVAIASDDLRQPIRREESTRVFTD